MATGKLHNGTNGARRPVLITGGAGFVGTNLAHRLLSGGEAVLIYDNFSRPGVERNLAWLKSRHGHRLEFERGDIRDAAAVRAAARRAGAVFHLAAQVAVTTSLTDPTEDFEINARGTLNLLEALRACDEPPPLVFTSTNKVYGGLPDVPLREDGSRYEPADRSVRSLGIGEDRTLDFHSPYGCSKGAADQYVIDYARTFGMPAVVFRMSCIYGPHQCGTEDQGWLAHFLIRAIQGQPITLYGDGKQVRDVLYVEDLVEAFLLAREHARRLSGRAFNIGGGPTNTTSLLELLELIRILHGTSPRTKMEDWRPGDQRYYVSDTRSFREAVDWKPRTGVTQGVSRLYSWLRDGGRERPAPATAEAWDDEQDEVTVAGGRRR